MRYDVPTTDSYPSRPARGGGKDSTAAPATGSSRAAPREVMQAGARHTLANNASLLILVRFAGEGRGRRRLPRPPTRRWQRAARRMAVSPLSAVGYRAIRYCAPAPARSAALQPGARGPDTPTAARSRSRSHAQQGPPRGAAAGRCPPAPAPPLARLTVTS